MNITFENPEKVSGLLTITVEEADYQDNVRKTLNEYRKKANIPGFRPGQAPLSLIKRQAGAQVKVDTINKLVGEKLYEYIKENKINMLGDPMPHLGEEPVDLDAPAPYTLKFDIAIAPEMDVKLGKDDSIVYYNIKAEDKMIDQQIDAYASRGGSYEKVEAYEDNDMLKGDLRELNADGSTKEGGITVSDAVMMPAYMKVDEQKAIFNGAKVGDIITFNPKKAYPESPVEISTLLKITKEEAENVEADFSYQVTEITRYKKHEINQELFDQVFGEGTVADEAAFRAKVAEGLQEQLNMSADYRFIADVRKYVENKLGEVKYADDIMKRIMLANTKDKENVDKNYEASIKELTWHLAKNKLLEQCEVKIDDNDVKSVAQDMVSLQFAQYGMTNIPEEYIENYVNEMLKKPEQVDQFVNQAADRKLMVALKDVVTLETKEISFEDFSKLEA
ncbi:MAG: trigger factor [Prevotellaceae bacterium]|nr:trigger factor [Prevotellaceae bacterium]